MKEVVMKTCKKCNEEKPLDEFYNQKGTKDGKRPRCKVCTDAYTAEYNKKNRERINERYRELRKENPEQWREYIDSRRGRHQERMENDPEYAEVVREKNRVRQRRWKSQLNNRLISNLRTRLNEYASGKRTDYRNKYTSKTREFLGCSIEEFRKHLESQFTEGMTWDNYGYYGWHVDHILPVDSFDMTDPEQQRKCFHYTNLQPLWAPDNFEKSNKIL
jgi:hypothetical protein